MTDKNILQFWLETAENDYQSAIDNFKTKHYDWAFFQYNLAVEKLLKGLIYKQNIVPQFTHDLLKLADTAQLTLTPNLESNLEEITTYNISARYDDYKRTFYHKVTQSVYYKIWQQNCQEVYLWLKKQY